MGLISTVATGAWIAGQMGHHRRLLQALAHPRRAQEARLFDLLARNAATRYGERHAFASIRSVREFQDRVPITTYDDLAPWIERVKCGEHAVLTAEPVLMFEKTGGSSAPAKYIPYTESLRNEFSIAVGAWLFDLYARRPALLRTRAYWSISPSARAPEVTPGGLRVGFDDDTQYFGGIARRLIASLLVVPPGASRLASIDTNRYVTLRFLLAARDLGLISVWSPTYLSILLDHGSDLAARLIEDVRTGRISPPAAGDGAGADDPALTSLRAAVSPDPSRAHELQDILGASGDLVPTAVWPRLRVVSCWMGGASRQLAQPLARRLPGVEIQPKGLLATEGVVSVPLGPEDGGVPALTSHVLEFRPVTDPAARPRLAWELDQGGRYTVILSTGGGLYRYDLGDIVRVAGRVRESPRLVFEGRSGGVSDLCGEKLDECFVATAITRSLAAEGHDAGFALLVPSLEPAAHYTLILDGAELASNLASRLQARLDAELRENPQYDYARRLGQLGSPTTACLGRRATVWYEEVCHALGQKPGSIKPAHLRRELDFARRLPRSDGRS